MERDVFRDRFSLCSGHFSAVLLIMSFLTHTLLVVWFVVDEKKKSGSSPSGFYYACQLI